MANRLTELEKAIAEERTPPTAQPVPTFARSSPSEETSYDIGSSSDQDSIAPNVFKTGVRRVTWQAPYNTMRSQVTSIKQSQFPSQGSQNGAFRAGLKLNPITALTTLVPIPDLSVPLQTSSSVSIVFNGTFQLSATATVSFAIFRDGIQVSRVYPQTPLVGVPFFASLDIVDTPPAGNHSYDARWATSAGTVTAAGYARTIQAQNTRPQ